MHGASYSSDSYAPLARLRRLQRLQVAGSKHVPACLPQLTQLTALAVSDWPSDMCISEPAAAVILEGLSRFKKLQHLALGPNIPGFGRPPAALAGVLGLHTLCWPNRFESFYPRQPALPGGPWLASLQRLVAPAAILASSLPALAAAQQLECLGVERVGPQKAEDAFMGEGGALEGAPHVLAVIGWAAHHPSLRLLLLEAVSGGLPVELCDAVLEAQRRRPDLHIKPCRDACKEAVRIQLGQTGWFRTRFY